MKQYQKINLMKAVAVSLLCAALCGCTQTQEQPTATGEPYGVRAPSDVDAAKILTDISTTQYFTDQEVAQEDIEMIVHAGINAPSAMNGQPWHFSVITGAEILQQISDGMGFGGMTPGSEGGKGLPEGMDFEVPEDFNGTIPEGVFPSNMDAERPEGMETPEKGSAPGVPAMPGGMNKAGITDAPLVVVISCKDGSELDAGLACQNMSATAQLLGYGTKIVTSPTMALNGSDQDSFRELLGIPEDYSAVAILLVGHEDTSVDESMDGYTGATTRYEEAEIVTYVMP